MSFVILLARPINVDVDTLHAISFQELMDLEKEVMLNLIIYLGQNNWYVDNQLQAFVNNNLKQKTLSL